MANGKTANLTVRIPIDLMKEFKIRCIEYGLSNQTAGKLALETWLAASSKDNLKPFNE